MIKELITGFKAVGVNDLRFPQSPGYTIWQPKPRRSLKNVDARGSSIVSPVMNAMATAYSEPTLRLYERIEGSFEEVPDAPVTDLIAAPNPYMESDLIDKFICMSIIAEGDAYLHKVRNLAGEVLQVWPLYPQFMKPHTPKDGSEFLDYWLYQIPGADEVKLPTADVIHLRWDINKDDMRLGVSLLKPLLSEVLTDEEAAQYTIALLANVGVPGVVMTPKQGAPALSADNAELAARTFQTKFTGTKRGEPFVSSYPMDITPLSFSPEQMDLTNIRRIPEERISANIWPAILSGLGAGLTATSGRGESKTIKEDATESRLIPRWKLNAQQWTAQLLRDFDDNPAMSLRFDLSEVRALSEDEDAAVKRIDVAVQGGWATVAEARRVLNLEVDTQHDVFLRSAATLAVGVSEDPSGLADPTQD